MAFPNAGLNVSKVTFCRLSLNLIPFEAICDDWIDSILLNETISPLSDMAFRDSIDILDL